MKSIKKDRSEKDLTELILLLRFGIRNPSMNSKPVLNLVSVAKLSRVTTSMVTRIIKEHKNGDFCCDK